MTPIPMILSCPKCATKHVDTGEWATRPHRTHRCEGCLFEWRPTNVPTVGVRELPDEGNDDLLESLAGVLADASWNAHRTHVPEGRRYTAELWGYAIAALKWFRARPEPMFQVGINAPTMPKPDLPPPAQEPDLKSFRVELNKGSRFDVLLAELEKRFPPTPAESAATESEETRLLTKAPGLEEIRLLAKIDTVRTALLTVLPIIQTAWRDHSSAGKIPGLGYSHRAYHMLSDQWNWRDPVAFDAWVSKVKIALGAP